jgi:DNA-binding MarR family transcriptional regulator
VRAMLLLLERRGLITRGRHPTDARARMVGLTVKGRRMYERLWDAVGPVREQLLVALGPGDVEVLRALLARVTAAMARRLHQRATRPERTGPETLPLTGVPR